MTFLEHINLYFGTEYTEVKQFIRDIKNGDLAEDYYDDTDKLTHVLMFISSYSRIEGK